jgi:hypothetical protein
MARRLRLQDTPVKPTHVLARILPWKLFLLLFFLALIVVPAYIYGFRQGGNVMPMATKFFVDILNAHPVPTPTVVPTFASTLPQVGSLLYTVQEGDSCVGFLSSEMRMADAGEIFSDLKPETVRALSASQGQDCHKLQPGMVLPLAPQYPLVAIGGVVRKIDATSPQMVVPTPLITVPSQDQGADCSGGCLFTVQVGPTTEVRLTVQTSLAVHIGAWIWAEAMLARKSVAGFDTYPYADPHVSLNGMALSACDFQVDTVHDPSLPSCSQLQPNTIDDDGGAWLFGAIGPSGLDHWHYGVHAPVGTRVLLWLTEKTNGQLTFQAGNPAYRYDEAAHQYVKL